MNSHRGGGVSRYTHTHEQPACYARVCVVVKSLTERLTDWSGQNMCGKMLDDRLAGSCCITGASMVFWDEATFPPTTATTAPTDRHSLYIVVIRVRVIKQEQWKTGCGPWGRWWWSGRLRESTLNSWTYYSVWLLERAVYLRQSQAEKAAG